MEVFFKNSVVNNNAKFADAFASNNFSISYGTPEQPVMMRDHFTVRTARAPRARGRAINVAAISISAKDIQKFVAHIMNVKEIIANKLNVDFEKELKNYTLLINAWVETRNNSLVALNKLKDINGIANLQGFTCHRTPFDKLEFMSESSQGMLDYDEWYKIEIDSTENGEYLLSFHCHGNSIERAVEYLKVCNEKTISIVNGIEAKVASQ
jgi:hypothetical protein